VTSVTDGWVATSDYSLAGRSIQWERRATVFEGLRSKIKERRARRLLRRLHSNTSELVGISSLMALARRRDPRSVEPLIQALSHPEPGMRRFAAEALGELGDTRAIVPLVELLVDRASDESVAVSVRQVAATALAKLGEVEWREMAGIGDPSHGLERLAQRGDSRLLTPLLSVLRDAPSSVIRADAAAALGKLGNRRAVQPLMAATMDSSWDVQRNAFEALGELEAVEGFEFLLAEAKAGSHCAVSGLTSFGDVRGADAVIEVLDHWRRQGAADDAYWLLRALGRIGGERAFQHLKQEVEAGEPEAIWPLARTGDPRAVDVLIQRLRKHDPGTIGDSDAVGIANAAGSLAKLGDPRAVEPLVDVLEDNIEPPVAAENFHHAESRRVKMLLPVIRAVGELADSRAIAEVRKLTKDQPAEIEEEAMWALRKLDSKRDTT
jgi:HEAT repeat protein